MDINLILKLLAIWIHENESLILLTIEKKNDIINAVTCPLRSASAASIISCNTAHGGHPPRDFITFDIFSKNK